MLVRVKSVGKARRGAAVVETAVILSTLLVMILGVVEYGRIVMLRQLLQNAAREGARLAVVGSGRLDSASATQAIENRVKDMMSGQSVDNMQVSVYRANSTSGAKVGAWDEASYSEPIVVRVEGDYTSVLPTSLGILSDPLHMTAVSMMRSEAN